MSIDTTNRLPSLAETMKNSIDARLKGVNTAMPAIIQSFDPETMLAEVQPAIMTKLVDEDAQNLPIIRSVPVQFPRSETAGFYFPLKKGDSCLLVCSQRSIDKWVTSGGVVDPQDSRKFKLTDAVALVGLYPTTSQLPMTADDLKNLVVINDSGKIVIKEDGTVIAGNDSTTMEINSSGFILQNSTDELLDLLVQTLTALQAVTVNTSLGPMAFNNLPDFASLQSKLEAMKG